MSLWTTLASYWRRDAIERDMAEEMRLHREQQVERNLAAGMAPAEAEAAARRQFGHPDAIAEAARDERGWGPFDRLGQDLRFADRMLRKHPGFTVAAVLTLALGIGFVTTIFTMINGVAFGQLPFEESQRIVNIAVDARAFDEFARRQQSCESLAFAQPTSANLRAGAFVSRYPAAVVSANFLDVLRARPAAGRGFLPEDELPGAPPVVLISHGVWERELEKGDVQGGREVRVNGVTRTVVGVMPAGFGFPFHQEIWIPRRTDEPAPGGLVFGRLRPEVSARLASAEFTALSRELSSAAGSLSEFVWDADVKPADGDTLQPVVEVVPFAERTVKPALRIMLSAILGATFLVLLLACANVAHLVLARAVDRRKELALRAALGASRRRLIRQMLTESMVVALIGAAGGLMIASWTTSLMWAYMMKEQPLTGGAPFWMNFDVDSRVFAFVAATAVLASVLTGLVPALRASKVDLNNALKDGSGGGPRESRFTRFLVNVQMAFSVCLVTVAGLFVTVLITFNQKTLPYDPAALFTAQVSLDEERYDSATARIRFFDQLLGRLQVTPGVETAALTSAESLRRTRTLRIELEGATYARERPECPLDAVSPNFLESFGVGVVAGRTFTAADHAEAPPVAMVSAAFVERFGANEDFVGRRFRLAGDPAAPNPWVTIVGIVPELGSVKAGEKSRGAVIYRPLAQDPQRAVTILVGGKGDVSRFAATLRREVAALDPELPVARLQSVQEIIELERIGMNGFAALFVACGLGALLLASVGVYGVISFAVKRRTREFGVRMALGADRATIIRLVLAQGLRQIAIGLAVGAVLAAAASTVLRSMFFVFGRSGYDVAIYAGVLGLLAVVAGAALLIPARRAAKVDPMIALRTD